MYKYLILQKFNMSGLIRLLYLSAIFLTALLLFQLNLGSVHAQEPSIESVLDEITVEQGIDNLDQLDCSKVSQEQLEQLGEALMSVMHPDAEVHELMDNMMGGEGSEALKARHIYMGSNYLGCYNGSAVNSGSSLNMMGRMGNMMGMMGGMMGTVGGFGSYTDNSLGTFNTMMGFFNPMLIGWILVIAVVLIGGIAVVVAVVKAAGGGKAASDRKWPIEILRERYAKG